MNLAVLKSRALAGMDALPVSVEMPPSKRLPDFTIVGLKTPNVPSLERLAQASPDKGRASCAQSGDNRPFPICFTHATIYLT